MKKILNLLVFLIFTGLQVAFAQRTISGTITKANDDTSLSGVTVLLKGTNVSGISDGEGKYSIPVPDEHAVLQFSFIGFTSQEFTVGDQSTLNISLVESAQMMSEVVVTALGIKRASRTLGYAVTTVNQEDIRSSRSPNMMESLEGKVSGLNISIPAVGVGGSSQLRLRGQAGFAGANNSPLLVINGLPMDQDARSANGNNMRDLGDNLNNINPEDIESMSVLKGATAAAIYGSRAANGAIIITTKAGRRGQYLGVEFSSSYTSQQPLDYFKPQTVYGQGLNGLRPTSQSNAVETGQFGWGAKYDGQPTPIFDGSTPAYAYQPHRLLDYFRNGEVYTNTIAVSGGGKNGSFRASFSSTDGSGIEPTNEYKRKVFNIGVNQDISNKLKFTTNINYTKEDYINPPQVGQQGAGSMNFFTRLAPSIPISAIRNSAVNPATGTEMQTSIFQGTVLNPYYAETAGQSYVNTRDRFLGTSTLRFDLTDWLYAQARYNYDYAVSFTENKTPGGIGTSQPINTADGTWKGSYSLSEGIGTNVNADFLVGASKRFNKFSVDASLGGNTYRVKYHNFNETATNFVVRDFFAMSNGTVKTPSYGNSQTKVNSLYGWAEFGYNSTFYLNIAGRKDWFSALPTNHSKFYPSVSGSFVFSELLNNLKWLDYAKLRGAWAKVGSSSGLGTNEGQLTYGLGNYQFNGQTTTSIANGSAPNPFIQPLTVTEKEIGLEARLFNNKLHVDLGYFDKVTTDQIMSFQLSETSGYDTSKKNTGSLKNSGLETLVEYTAIKTRDFSWETSWNNTYLKTEVLSVGKNPDGTPIQDFLVLDFNGTGNEFLGQLHYTVGMATNQLYTRTYARNDKGQILLTNAGRLIASDNYVPVGSSIPKYTGGWNNTFTYKKFTLGVFIDYKLGGMLLSATNLNMTRQGLSELSLEGRRDGENGLVFPGVYKSTGLPNTAAVTKLQDFYGDYRNLQIGDPFTFKSDFVKLRHISISYDLTGTLNKVKMLSFVKGLSLTASCRNVAILYKDIPNLDPEAMQSSGDFRAGYENSALLTTRNFTFTLNAKF